MSSTIKTIIFIISIFTFLLFFIPINYILPFQPVPGASNSSFPKSFVYITGYIAVLYSQALMKHLYTSNSMKNKNILKTIPVESNELRDRLIPLVLPVIAVIMPMVSKKGISFENLQSLVYLAVLVIIIEVLFHINGRTMKIYVTNKGFAINGVDFRLELSIPFSYTNAAGWYPFERIENYRTVGNKVFLYQTYDMGLITFECSGEEVRQIKGLLISNGVPERRY